MSEKRPSVGRCTAWHVTVARRKMNRPHLQLDAATDATVIVEMLRRVPPLTYQTAKDVFTARRLDFLLVVSVPSPLPSAVSRPLNETGLNLCVVIRRLCMELHVECEHFTFFLRSNPRSVRVDAVIVRAI